eukprot:s1763_g4.t1
MLKLPYVQEIYRYMLLASPDLCNAGNLIDPQTQKPIKKGLNVVTSSQKLFNQIDSLRCTRDHEHQIIEGSTKVDGVNMSRSKFSERYPRKFARLLAKAMIKSSFPCEKPVGMIADPALVLFDAISAETNAVNAKERPAKRQKRIPSKGIKHEAAAGELAPPGVSKRLKVPSSEILAESTTSSSSSFDKKALNEIVGRIEKILPRVGKTTIESPAIHKDLQVLFPTMLIQKVVACKGTDRRWGPPKGLNPSEAPFRRSIMKLRESMEIAVDPIWEQYDMLSHRQLIRKSPACRVNITMFAARMPSVPSPGTTNEQMQVSQPVPTAQLVNAPSSTDQAEEPDSPDGTPNPEPEVNAVPKSLDVKPDDPNSLTDKISLRPSSDNPPPSHDPHPEELPETKTDTVVLPDLSESHGPRFKALPREEQNMLRRAHQNLCHPSPEQLSAVLRSQGCRPELSQAVFDMKCSTCSSCQKPKIARPSSFKDALDFNDKVFVDGVSWTSKAGQSFHFYHFLDQATNFHVAIPAPSRTAEQAILKTSEAWFNWAGPPNTLVMDSATEFTSEQFQEFLQRYDVKDTVTSPHAHWQNGRCERHGQILQTMLTKIDHESPILSFSDLQQALIQCTHAKNCLSIRKGYSPEILVFGKSSKVPGSIISSDEMSAHASANREDAHGIEFRRQLALRERARIAFHQADNDMALRRAILRRSRPNRQGYQPGEYVMMWQPQSNHQGYWFGPLKVVQQEENLSIWATKGGRLHRRAPEHVRPVNSAEARQVTLDEADQSPEPISRSTNGVGLLPEPISTEPPAIGNPPSEQMGPHNPEDNSSQSQDQPDTEPEENNPEDPNVQETIPSYIDTPVPNFDADDDLVTTHLLCCDAEVLTVDPAETPCAWRFEVEIPNHWNPEMLEMNTADEILLASTEKKQRTEVKLSMLSPEEKQAFLEAKQTEVKNWLATGTVSRILRSKLAPEQILRCRWLLVWKDRDDLPKTSEESTNTEKKSPNLESHKPKARLVVLGYLDPNLTEADDEDQNTDHDG